MKGIGIHDTTGAGDAFNGAFLHGIARGMHPTDATQLALIASGLKCRKRGAVDSQPSKNEVYGYYERMTKKIRKKVQQPMKLTNQKNLKTKL